MADHNYGTTGTVSREQRARLVINALGEAITYLQRYFSGAVADAMPQAPSSVQALLSAATNISVAMHESSLDPAFKDCMQEEHAPRPPEFYLRVFLHNAAGSEVRQEDAQNFQPVPDNIGGGGGSANDPLIGTRSRTITHLDDTMTEDMLMDWWKGFGITEAQIAKDRPAMRLRYFLRLQQAIYLESDQRPNYSQIPADWAIYQTGLSKPYVLTPFAAMQPKDLSKVIPAVRSSFSWTHSQPLTSHARQQWTFNTREDDDMPMISAMGVRLWFEPFLLTNQEQGKAPRSTKCSTTKVQINPQKDRADILENLKKHSLFASVLNNLEPPTFRGTSLPCDDDLLLSIQCYKILNDLTYRRNNLKNTFDDIAYFLGLSSEDPIEFDQAQIYFYHMLATFIIGPGSCHTLPKGNYSKEKLIDLMTFFRQTLRYKKEFQHRTTGPLYPGQRYASATRTRDMSFPKPNPEFNISLDQTMSVFKQTPPAFSRHPLVFKVKGEDAAKHDNLNALSNLFFDFIDPTIRTTLLTLLIKMRAVTIESLTNGSEDRVERQGVGQALTAMQTQQAGGGAAAGDDRIPHGQHQPFIAEFLEACGLLNMGLDPDSGASFGIFGSKDEQASSRIMLDRIRHPATEKLYAQYTHPNLHPSLALPFTDAIRIEDEACLLYKLAQALQENQENEWIPLLHVYLQIFILPSSNLNVYLDDYNPQEVVKSRSERLQCCFHLWKLGEQYDNSIIESFIVHINTLLERLKDRQVPTNRIIKILLENMQYQCQIHQENKVALTFKPSPPPEQLVELANPERYTLATPPKTRTISKQDLLNLLNETIEFFKNLMARLGATTDKGWTRYGDAVVQFIFVGLPALVHLAEMIYDTVEASDSGNYKLDAQLLNQMRDLHNQTTPFATTAAPYVLSTHDIRVVISVTSLFLASCFERFVQINSPILSSKLAIATKTLFDLTLTATALGIGAYGLANNLDDEKAAILMEMALAAIAAGLARHPKNIAKALRSLTALPVQWLFLAPFEAFNACCHFKNANLIRHIIKDIITSTLDTAYFAAALVGATLMLSNTWVNSAITLAEALQGVFFLYVANILNKLFISFTIAIPSLVPYIKLMQQKKLPPFMHALFSIAIVFAAVSIYVQGADLICNVFNLCESVAPIPNGSATTMLIKPDEGSGDDSFSTLNQWFLDNYIPITCVSAVATFFLLAGANAAFVLTFLTAALSHQMLPEPKIGCGKDDDAAHVTIEMQASPSGLAPGSASRTPANPQRLAARTIGREALTDTKDEADTTTAHAREQKQQ
jgi:hypothetical protein